jgi:hypothetical protein
MLAMGSGEYFKHKGIPRKSSGNSGRKMSMIPLDEDKEPSETLNETTDIREREIIKFGQMLKAGKYPRTT